MISQAKYSTFPVVAQLPQVVFRQPDAEFRLRLKLQDQRIRTFTVASVVTIDFIKPGQVAHHARV